MYMKNIFFLCLLAYFLFDFSSMSFSSAAFRRCRKLLESAGIEVGEPVVDVDPKNAAYDACSLRLGGKPCCYRTAKITPTKNGAFVTCWKRPGGKGPIVPFTPEDLHALLVAVEEGSKFGFFVFPAKDLLKQKILSKESGGEKGKLSFRVYAPWVATESKQAAATQTWQNPFFVESGKRGCESILQETFTESRKRPGVE
ncbi:unnamed protein product [Durusdinium trenchii]|uniref:Uncharacterized protein n=1 Tax=Durusdinium trenchii TaxID=1381693 RepID=A0ABP0S3I2_9DINO